MLPEHLRRKRVESMESNSKFLRNINAFLAENRRGAGKGRPTSYKRSRSAKAFPPSARNKRNLNAQDLADYYDSRRWLRRSEAVRKPSGKKFQTKTALPEDQKGLLSPAPDAEREESLREELKSIALPVDARQLVLAYAFDQKAGMGSYAVLENATGEKTEKKVEAASLRHFQVLMLEQILQVVSSDGNVVLFCDDLSLVEHFSPKQWEYYRANDWKEPNGDKLHFRVLYQQLDEAIGGRMFVVAFPELNIPQVEKLLQRAKALMKQRSGHETY